MTYMHNITIKKNGDHSSSAAAVVQRAHARHFSWMPHGWVGYSVRLLPIEHRTSEGREFEPHWGSTSFCRGTTFSGALPLLSLSMPKKGSRTKSSLPTGEDNPTFPRFPVIAPKSGLVCRALLEDQIIIINVNPLMTTAFSNWFSIIGPSVCWGVQEVCRIYRRTTSWAHSTKEEGRSSKGEL